MPILWPLPSSQEVLSSEKLATPGALRRIYLPGRTTGEGYPDAVVAHGLVFTSGVRAQTASEGFAALPPEGRVKQQGYPVVDHCEGQVSASAWGAHETLERVLAAAGSDNSQILRQHVWQKDKRFFPAYEQARRVWQPVPSPSSGLGVGHIPGEGVHWIGLDAIAAAPGQDPVFGAREVIAAVDQAQLPSASHYSQAVRSGPLVFTAGHIPIKTSEPGKPVVRGFDDVAAEGRALATGRSHPDSRDGPIAAQTWYVYEELKALLARAGLGLDDVVLATVYLADVRDFPVFHRVHRQSFGAHEPALAVSTFDEVGHRGCSIEIELTARDPAFGLALKPTPWRGVAPFAAPAAMQVGPFVFFSGMLGHDPEARMVSRAADLPPAGRALVEPLEASFRPGVAAQAHAALERLAEAAADAGGSLQHLVKLTVYLEDGADRAAFEAVRAHVLPAEALPALEFIVVVAPGPTPAARLQLEAIAAV